MEYRVYGDDLEEIMIDLIKENFLNEERFAQSFVRGKFRMKKWGRNKIVIELKKRKISDYCIRKGLKEIDEEEYLQTLEEVASKKWNKLTGYDSIKRQKTYEYCLRRGFELGLITKTLNRLYPY